MSQPTDSSVMTRLIHGANQQAPILEVEHGVATQVVRNPYLRQRRSRAGYVLGGLLLLAGVVVAWAVATRTSMTRSSTEVVGARQPASLSEPVAAVASAEPVAELVPFDEAVLVPFDEAVLVPSDKVMEDEAFELDDQTDLESALGPEADPAVDTAPGSITRPRSLRRPARRPRRRAQVRPNLAVTKGVLMISSKPPCRIYVNGKDTGLTTPQRDIKLKQGKHKIMLLNREFGVKYRVSVRIRAGAKVRIVRDLRGSMK